MPSFLGIDLSAGQYESASFAMADGKATLQVDATDVKTGCMVEILQSLDDSDYTAILDDQNRGLSIWIDPGTKSYSKNLVGVYASTGIVRVTPGKAPAATGTLDVHVLT